MQMGLILDLDEGRQLLLTWRLLKNQQMSSDAGRVDDFFCLDNIIVHSCKISSFDGGWGVGVQGVLFIETNQILGFSGFQVQPMIRGDFTVAAHHKEHIFPCKVKQIHGFGYRRVWEICFTPAGVFLCSGVLTLTLHLCLIMLTNVQPVRQKVNLKKCSQKHKHCFCFLHYFSHSQGGWFKMSYTRWINYEIMVLLC